jgi:hypothetical protein
MNVLKINRPTAIMKKFYSLIAVIALVVSTFVSQATPSPAFAADYSAPLNTTTALSGYSVNASITGTVRVLLRTNNPSGRLSVTSYTNVWGIRNTPNYTATSGSSTLGTAGQMIGLSGPAASINAALATLQYSSTTTGTDTITMWVSNGSEYIPLMNGSDIEFHYYVFRNDAATPAAATSMASSVGTIDGQTGVTTYLATLRYQVEDVFASQIMVSSGNKDQAWIAARDDVEGQWKWFGPDADGVQFWSGDNSGIYSVNGEYWNWGRTAANSGLQRPWGNSGRHCMMLNASSLFTYGLVRQNGSNNYWYGWHNGMCTYGTTWMYEALVPSKPAGQNTNVTGANYSMTPSLKTVVIATPPDQPNGLTSSANASGNVELSWQAPSNTGTDPLSDYTIQYSQSSTFASGVTTWSHTPSTQTSATISDLSAGGTYYFRVAAVSTMTGAYSSTSTLTLPRLPSAPLNFVATPGDQTIDLSWSSPSDDGGSAITGYKLEYKESTSSTWIVASSSIAGTTYSLSSLTNGTNYDVRVSASNGFWGSTVSSTSVKPFGAVSNTAVPTIGGANAAGEILTASDGSWNSNGATVTTTNYQWQTRNAPSDGWSDISGATNSTYVLTGTNVGKYLRVKVSKTNGANSGAFIDAFSETSGIIQTGLALTPGNLATVFGDSSINVSWSIPTSNGGTISGIRVEYSLDGDVWNLSQLLSANSTSHTITGLTNGTGYFVRVTAVTAAGNGAYAISGDSVIPASNPINTSLPSISGSASYGSILSANAGSWNSNGRTLGNANYQWQYSTNSGSTWNDLTGETGDQLTVSGNIGAQLRVKVTRSNAVGSTIVYSSATSAVTASAPTGPQSVSVTPTDQTLTVTWVAPSNTGGVSLTDYQIQYSTDAVTWNTVTRTASLTTSQSITGLTNGTNYYVRVRALNGLNGAWAFSGSTQAPRGLPLQVSSPAVSGTPNYQQLLTASLGQWNSNGATITQTTYQWQSSSDGSTWTNISGATTNEYRVTAPVGSTLRVKITQTNSVGSTEVFTSATSAIAAVNAAAPAIVLRETGNAQFTVRWSAPAHNGGVPLSGYTVEYSTDQQVWTSSSESTTASEKIMTGLTNGQSYYVRVRAETDRNGEWSVVLGPIRPAAPVVPVVTPPASPRVIPPSSLARTTPVTTVQPDWSVVQNNIMPVPVAPSTLSLLAPGSATITSDGRVELVPSESVALINGSVVSSAVFSEQGDQAVADTGLTQVGLQFASSAGVALPGDNINLRASGFAPGSPLVVWIQSTPTKLVATTADTEGSEATEFTIPRNLKPGSHTLQINGVDANGNIVSLAYGIEVQTTPTDSQAQTQTEQNSVNLLIVGILIFLVLLVIGVVIYFFRRKALVD